MLLWSGSPGSVASSARRKVMKNLPIRAFVVLASIAAVGTAAADETYRCGGKLIEPGMTQSEVLAQCGDPTSKSVEAQDVRSGNQVVGKTEVHRWTYESYSATRVLVFDQDRLVSIE
jgi:hypothetical protein